MKKIIILLCCICMFAVLVACKKDGEQNMLVNNQEQSVQDNQTDVSNQVEPEKGSNISEKDEHEQEKLEEQPVEMYADFTNGQPTGFEVANGWTNGSMFNVTWRKANVTFENGNMQLIIDKDATPKDNIPYSGGEFRSKDFYGYGKYEVSMKAAKNDGIVSSFFTYTGPSDNNPWDEIDIEFLGKDTTKVQFNYFTSSRGNHEYIYDLGFDASEEFHTYGFEWYEDKIIWYVDGEAVHTANTNIPSTKGKIMMNAWCGTGVDSWLNAFDDANLPIIAEYQWIKYTPFE